MNELFKVTTDIDNDRITLSARDLHEFLEIESNFTTWFKRMCEYGFEQGKDFIPFLEESTGGRPSQEYQLTVDMAKEIAMLQRNDKGKEARSYFIELEKEFNSPERIISRGLIESKKMIDNLNAKLLEIKPKVDFYDAVADSKTAIPMDQVAKVLDIAGIGRNKLFELLRDKKILQLSNIPYQAFVDRGYFRVVESKFTKPNGETCISIKTLVYQKGVEYIRKQVS